MAESLICQRTTGMQKESDTSKEPCQKLEEENTMLY